VCLSAYPFPIAAKLCAANTDCIDALLGCTDHELAELCTTARGEQEESLQRLCQEAAFELGQRPWPFEVVKETCRKHASMWPLMQAASRREATAQLLLRRGSVKLYSANRAFEASLAGKRSGAQREVIVEAPLKERMARMANAVLSTANAGGTFVNATKKKEATGLAKRVLQAVRKDVTDGHTQEELDAAEVDSGLNSFLTAEVASENEMVLTMDDVSLDANGESGEAVGPEEASAIEGDMIPRQFQHNLLSTASQQGITTPVGAGVPWPSGQVKYCFASDTPPLARFVFEAATAQYTKALPCLRFINVGWKSGMSSDHWSSWSCQEPQTLFVTGLGRGCFSYVGYTGWEAQQLNLAPFCSRIGTAIHELGHALGMAHEQSRPDRHHHIKVHWENIRPGMERNFAVDPDAYVDGPYDFQSIMHYSARLWAANRSEPVLEPIDPDFTGKLGQRVGLSQHDVEQMHAMYITENASCTSRVISGRGCINRTNDEGKDVCSALTDQCTLETTPLCCACGGGLRVQCYEGEDCPSVEPLPPMNASDCMEDRTADYGGDAERPCVFRNLCNYPVEWSCPAMPCTHTTQGDGRNRMQGCRGQVQTQICTEPTACRFKRR